MQQFDVRFFASPFSPRNAFRLRGAGTITIEPDFVVVRGRRARLLGVGEAVEFRLRRADVCNSWTSGRLVGFQAREIDAVRDIECEAADQASARALQLALPQRETDAFTREIAEENVFHDRIDHHSPRAWATYVLIALNVVVFTLVSFAPMPRGGQAIQLIQWGSNAGPLTLHGQWWRLLTSMFLHGSWAHLLFNMVALAQSGVLVERMFGTARFLVLYVGAGIAGGLASVMWNVHVNSVGASGAIFGIFGGLLAFFHQPYSGVPPTVTQQLRGSALAFILFNIGAGFVYPHTDNAAHLGGLAGGFVLGLLLARSLHLPRKPSE